MGDPHQSLFRSDHSRGQFLIAGAFLLVLLLLSAVAVANLAVTTETERQQGQPPAPDDLEKTLIITEQSLNGALQHVNHDPGITTQSDRRTSAEKSVTTAVALVDKRLSYEGGAVTGSIRTVSGSQTIDGRRVAQEDSAPYSVSTGSGPQANWTVVSGSDATRQATFLVDLGALESASRPLIVKLNGDTYALRATPSAGETQVTLSYGGTTCTVGTNNSTIQVDYLAGTLGKASCPNYPTPDQVTRLRIENGDVTTGAYSITYLGTLGDTNGNVARVTSPPAQGDADETADVTHHAVYAVIVDVDIATGHGTASRPIIVAPGGHSNPLKPLQ